MCSEGPGWTEDASRFFLEYGEVFTSSQAEQIETLVSLIPAGREDRFLAVDLACGVGNICAAPLERYPACRVLALDGSEEMLEAAATRLARYGDRVVFDTFDLRRDDRLSAVDQPVRCFVSSLAIHHLDDDDKQRLFQELRERLEPRGAMLIADIVDAVNELARRLYAAAWDAIVREQARVSGPEHAYATFRSEEWNHYQTPEVDFDKPGKLFDQLRWLTEVGFRDVGCFWLRAGHAVYGSYAA
ncbi:MAG: class I SAM-dependent methyltransferase [Chloroflexota bacterium]